jgi:o-succinylbenzoate synthase
VRDLRAALEARPAGLLADVEELVTVESPTEDLEAVRRCAEVVAGLGTRLTGAYPEWLEADGRPHLRWRFGSGDRALLLGHFDTVWPMGSLDTHPFAVEDGRLTGPGCFDMKAGVVQLFHALAALDDLDGVTVLVTSDEETGSRSSRPLIEDEARRTAAVLVLEASEGGALKTARKGVSTYDLRVTGLAAHAGLEPHRGVNATVELAHQVLAISGLGDQEAGTTVTPTVAASGTTRNTVPASAEVLVDVRAETAAEQARVDTAMRGLTPALAGIETDEAEGYGECVTMTDPVYSSEYTDGAADVLHRFLIPALFERPRADPWAVAPALAPFKGHRMAKAVLETAVLDAWLRSNSLSFGEWLGATAERVPAGVSVGIMDSIPELLDAVDGYLAEGYLRIKLKIEPGWDVEPVRAVRERFGDEVLLQVDANTAYTLADAPLLARLDDFGLLLIEQPLDEEDVLGHARLAERVRTPICLDESIVSARSAADAIALRACSIVNIKPGRVGGYLEARRIHDVCAAHGIPVWCGGMLETGLGRAANVALAALPGFTLPGDTSASDRYYRTDITEPFLLQDGHLEVPRGAGIGVSPVPERLAEVTVSTEWIAR